MTIREAFAISYTEMSLISKGLKVTWPGLPPTSACEEIWVISITDSTLPKLFQDSEKILTLEFADIDPQNPSFNPPENTEFMKPEQAVKAVDFLERAQASDKEILLLVNCRHGMCRSGAVMDFAANVYGLGFWDTKKKNPQSVPNYWVRFLLFKEYFRRSYHEPYKSPKP